MNCDILVIGAGILGLSSAYYLKKQNPNKRIIVIEKYGGPGQGNTAKSAANFKNLYASETNYLLSDSTMRWIFHLQNKLGYNLNIAHIGYLWLFNEPHYSRLKKALDKMRDKGIELRTYEKEDLRRMIPDLVTDFDGDKEAEQMALKPIDVGVQGVSGYCVNTDALVRSYESEFLKQGGEIKYNTTTTRLILKPQKKLGIPGEPFIWQDIKVVGAKTKNSNIYAETTVVAAGVWSDRLLDPIGFNSMMKPKTRMIFVFNDPKLKGLQNVRGLNDYGTLPQTHIPMARIYLKVEPTERSIWLGIREDFGREFGFNDDPQPNENIYTNNAYYALVKYLPCFVNVRPLNMWAGQRAINSFDGLPVVAPTPGMIYVGAASGSGILKSDSLGRIVAALYAGEKKAELYGNRYFRVADLGVTTRLVEKETFII